MRRPFAKMIILLPLLIMIVMTGCWKQEGALTGEPSRSPVDSPLPTNTNGAQGSVEPATPADRSPSPDTASPSSSAKSGAQPTPSPSQKEAGTVTAVRLADADTGWTGGPGWIARTEDGGRHWQTQYRGKGTVRQLFALNAKQAWAVIESSDLALLGTTDGGENWKPVGKVPNKGFLHFVSTLEAFSANARTTDGGKSWTALPVPSNTVGDAYFHDRNNGWAVTQGKGSLEVRRTEDGGKTWRTVMSRKTVASLNGAVIRSAGTQDAWVLCIGGSGMTQTSFSLFHTSDGGNRWQTVLAHSTAGGGPAPGFPVDYNGGPRHSGSSPGPLYVVNPQTAFLGGYCGACDKPNTVGSTTDGGKTWRNGEQSLDGFGGQYVAFADQTHGWLISGDHQEPSVMYTTSDGGRTWKKTHVFGQPQTASSS